MGTCTYPLDNAWLQARQRLAALEHVYDPGTIAHLERLGVGPGRSCLEVGGGGGSITEWLCRRVGATGRVLATDLDTRFLDLLDHPNLTVRRHDIATEALPEAAFDLVHLRAVLRWLPEHGPALDRLTASLKPGGWLLVEDQGGLMTVDDRAAAPVFADLVAKFNEVLRRLGGPRNELGRRLFRELLDRGLGDVGAELRTPLARGGDPYSEFVRLTQAQRRDAYIGTGAVTGEELDAYAALATDPAIVYWGLPMVATWGRQAA